MKTSLFALVLLFVLSAACSPAATPPTADTPGPLPSATATLTPAPTATSTLAPSGGLTITFDPNPVVPTQTTKGVWVWAFTFYVYNPNDFPIEIVAFGNYDGILNKGCLDDMASCEYSADQFAGWFGDCEAMGKVIPATQISCDDGFWIESDSQLVINWTSHYVFYYLDGDGAVQQAVSEPLIQAVP